MSNFFSKNTEDNIEKWHIIDSPEMLQTIKAQSRSQKVFIFKHSSRCSISRVVLHKLEKQWKQVKTPRLEGYFLDLIRYRNLSDEIAFTFSVKHESPQVLLIDNEICIWSASHMNISWGDLLQAT